MDRQEFISYVHEPAKLSKSSLTEIEELSKEFPYCQSLSILHLLNLRMTNLVRYENQLKSTAAHIADRKRLKELIGALGEESEKTEVVETHPPEEPIVPVIEDDEEERLLALKQIVEDRLKEISSRKGSAEEEPEGGKWVLTKDELIDKFIEEEPSISRPKKDFFDPVKVAKNSMEEKDGLVSETLARIHIQQGNIDKAIEIYRKLSLKFPEKSSYFASQIKKFSTEN
jgi:hypothetical protein